MQGERIGKLKRSFQSSKIPNRNFSYTKTWQIVQDSTGIKSILHFPVFYRLVGGNCYKENLPPFTCSLNCLGDMPQFVLKNLPKADGLEK